MRCVDEGPKAGNFNLTEDGENRVKKFAYIAHIDPEDFAALLSSCISLSSKQKKTEPTSQRTEFDDLLSTMLNYESFRFNVQNE